MVSLTPAASTPSRRRAAFAPPGLFPRQAFIHCPSHVRDGYISSPVCCVNSTATRALRSIFMVDSN
jgi:hypothetical protein